MAATIEEYKDHVRKVIDGRAKELLALSDFIHGHAELGGKECLARDALAGFLQKCGYHCTAGIAGLDTAFAATQGTSGPRIGFLAEYDALPDLGHACGHNLIAAMAAGLLIGHS